MESQQKSAKYWFRWIAVFPGALIISILILFPLHWLLYLIYANGGTLLGFIELPNESNNSIEYTITPFVIAITFILSGFKIAPAYKLKTAIILVALYTIAFISLLIVADKYELQVNFQLRSIGALIGLCLGLYIAWKKSRNINFNIVP